jgi:agmatine deiminase
MKVRKTIIILAFFMFISFYAIACQPHNLPPVDGILPEDGERLFANTNYNIRWPMPDPEGEESPPENTLEHLGDYVTIHLYKGGSFYSEIKDNTENSGSYVWKLDKYIDPDIDYSIRIMEAGNETNYADSDGNFTISKYRRVPAEWEELEAMWFTYTTGYNDFVPRMIKEVAEVVDAYVIIDSPGDETQAYNYLDSFGVNMSKVEFYVYNGTSYPAIWMRDFGPIYVFEAGERKILDFTHSYYCDDMPAVIGNLTNTDVIDASIIELPGGIYLSDGINTSFGSKALFVEPDGAPFGNSYYWNVNNYSSENAFLEDLSDFTGNTINILMDYMDNDKTHHIDMWSKQLDETTYVVGDYENQSDSNYTILNNVATQLENAGYTVIRIPQPEQLPYKNLDDPNSKFKNPRNRLIKTTITYTNALFVNGGENGKRFLMPSFTDSIFPGADTVNQQVKTIYENALPDYEVIMINSDSIIGSGGAIHCTTMQVPKEDRHVSFTYDD